MGLDDFIPSEAPEAGATASPEQVEKLREQAKKAAAGIKRVKKDEQKAKKQDFLLASFLTVFIKDTKYDFLLDDLFILLDTGVPSSFIVGLLSIIHLPISDKIRELSSEEKVIFDYKANEMIDFDEDNLHQSVRDRINYWIEDINLISKYDPSSVLTERIIEILNTDLRNDITRFTANLFIFFFEEINIEIQKNTSLSYSQFIIGEIEKSLKSMELEEV